MNACITKIRISHPRQHQAIITQLIYGLTGLFKSGLPTCFPILKR